MDIGVRRRLFTGATRRAVQLRDRECFHPYCEEPAEACQVDHIQRYTDGGPTTQDNGRCACGFHNRERERSP
jgi:HNH endonuclease